MSPLEGPWKTALPTLEAIDAHITKLEDELARVRAFREGVRLILSSTEGSGGGNDSYRTSVTGDGSELERLGAKDRLIRVLMDAGRPLRWSELQERVSRGPNPPTPGTIASAYYHNTKAGSRSFVPLPGGYAGLAGRDEDWEPDAGDETQSSGDSGKGTLRDLMRKFMETHAEFTLQELSDAILAERPDAVRHTIRGHLSYAKTKGEVENIGRGRWKSLLAAKASGEGKEETASAEDPDAWLLAFTEDPSDEGQSA